MAKIRKDEYIQARVSPEIADRVRALAIDRRSASDVIRTCVELALPRLEGGAEVSGASMVSSEEADALRIIQQTAQFLGLPYPALLISLASALLEQPSVSFPVAFVTNDLLAQLRALQKMIEEALKIQKDTKN